MVGNTNNDSSYSNAVRSSVQPGERSTGVAHGGTRRRIHATDRNRLRPNTTSRNSYQHHRFNPERSQTKLNTSSTYGNR